MSVLDPTKADVKTLDDTTLRELVVRLCQAEAALVGLASAGVTAGGDQTAPDGGIDVRVEGDLDLAGGYLPRLPLGIQVKAQHMTDAAIRKEMRPKGALRPVLSELAAAHGGYIIASGRDDLSDSRLGAVRATMQACVGVVTGGDLHIDFYDADRLARWAAAHSGVATWLCERAGRPTMGWSSLKSWSAPSQPLDAEYIVDDETRVVFTNQPDAFAVGDALDQIRDRLSVNKSVVRLVGLSGMGKTRLAQALFDGRLGARALAPERVVYGDAGASPEVSPQSMARQLADRRSEAILIVDNCPAALHNQLVAIAKETDAHFSLLTIDFDVEPDQPAHTQVVRLERAGDELIRSLLCQRAPALNEADRHRITRFAEGNTRVALVLSAAADPAGGLAKLKDRDLLDRLFLTQRRLPDNELRHVARVCALVYAFEVASQDGPVEADLLAELAGVSLAVFHDKLGDLLERGLAQKRGRQRAILPQAIAAWLALEALNRLSQQALQTFFDQTAPLRMQVSFARRLGLLHESPDAVAAGQALLQPGGRFGEPSDERGREMQAVAYLAPLDPPLALAAAERFVGKDRSARSLTAWEESRAPLTQLLRTLVYDADTFDRAAELMVIIAIGEPERSRNDDVTPKFLNLYHPARSGTLAPPAQRFAFLGGLLASPEKERRALGLRALDTALELQFAGAEFPAEFGSRPRGFGWAYTTGQDIGDWYGAALDRLVIAAKDPSISTKARDIICKHFRGLTRNHWAQPAAIAALRALADGSYWARGWFAACAGLNGAKPDVRTDALVGLEADLRPSTLRQRFDTWLLEDWNLWRDPNGGNDPRDWGGALAQAISVGREAASTTETWSDFATLALSTPPAAGAPFGEGLCEGTSDVEAGWGRLLAIARDLQPTELNWTVLAGYLAHARRTVAETAEMMIDTALGEAWLAAPMLKILASQAVVEEPDLHRILNLLKRPGVTLPGSNTLWIPKLAAQASPSLIADLVDVLVERGDWPSAVSILSFRQISSTAAVWDSRLLASVRKLLGAVAEFSEDGAMSEFQLEPLVSKALDSPEAEPIARKLLARIKQAALDSQLWLHGMPDLLATLFRQHPETALDVLIDDRAPENQYRLTHFLRGTDDDDRGSHNALSPLPLGTMMNWMKRDPEARAPRLADVVAYFQHTEEGHFGWTPMAKALLDCGYAEDAVLEVFGRRLYSGSSSGLGGERYIRRRPMIETLTHHASAKIRSWAQATLADLNERIASRALYDRIGVEAFE